MSPPGWPLVMLSLYISEVKNVAESGGAFILKSTGRLISK